MANYYVKKLNADGTGTTQYMASDGLSWTTDSGAAFVTTTQATADAIAAILNLMQLNITSFFPLGPAPGAIFQVTEVTF